MAWSPSRKTKQDKETIELVEALINTQLEEKLGSAFQDIKFTAGQSKEIIERIRKGDNNIDPLSAKTYLFSNELSAFNSNPEIVRALRVACEFVRVGEVVSDGMETNPRLAIKVTNSSFYNKLVKRTGQVHLAASATMTFFAIKTTWQAYASETEGSLSAKASAIANTTERLGDFGSDIFETIAEWRMVSNSSWFDNPKIKAINKALHVTFSGAEILGKGAEHIRYLVDEDVPLFMKVTSTLSVLLDSGGLAAHTWATEAAVKQVESIQDELKRKVVEKLKKTLNIGDDALKTMTKGEIDDIIDNLPKGKMGEIIKKLPKEEIDDIIKKFPIKNTVKGGLIGAQIAFLTADLITGVSSLNALDQHQKNLLQKALENPDQDHYKLLTDFYKDRFASDLGFLVGKTAVDVLFTSVSTALMFTGAGIPIALAIDLVGATVSSILSYAQQQEIESLALKRMSEIRSWEANNPGKNYFDRTFEDRYNQLKPSLRKAVKVFLDNYQADRAFVLTQLCTTDQINEAVGLFYKNKNGSSSDRLFVGEFVNNSEGKLLEEKATEHIAIDQKKGIIKISKSNDKKQLLYASPNAILLPGEVQWKKVDTGEISIWNEAKKIGREIKGWLAEHVFNGNGNRLGVGTSVNAGKFVGARDVNGHDYFFEDKENEYLLIENLKNWDINLGSDSSLADLTKLTTRIVLNKVETYEVYVPNGGYMQGSNGRYETRKKVVPDSNVTTIRIKAKSGDGDDKFFLGTGSHDIDAGGGFNAVDYSFINEQSSIRIQKSNDFQDENMSLSAEKTINGLVYEESIEKQQIHLGSKKYNTQFRVVKNKDVKNWKTEDTLKNITSFRLGKGTNYLDLTDSNRSIRIEAIGYTNDIKLGRGNDEVIIEANTSLQHTNNRQSHIRTRGGKDHVAITIKHAKWREEYYNENFICGGTDFDSQNNPADLQQKDTIEYAIKGDYAEDSFIRTFFLVNSLKGTPLPSDVKYGTYKFMESQYGDRARLHGTWVTHKGQQLIAIRSQYGIKVTWHDRKSLLSTNPFYHDLKVLSQDDGYLKIERYAPGLFYSHDKEKIVVGALSNKKLVGTDYVVHMENLILTHDDDEIDIQDSSGHRSLTIYTGNGDDQLRMGKGAYTIYTGKGSKTIKLGNGFNRVYHRIDELTDIIEADETGNNWLSFENNSDLFDKDGKRAISSCTKDTPYLSKLGVQVDLKAGKTYYYFKDEFFKQLADLKIIHYDRSVLSHLDDESKARLPAKQGIGDTISGFQNITGTRFNDIILGNEKGNIIDTGDGDDQVNAREGNDDIRLGRGADKGYGGSGDDIFIQDYDDATDELDGGSGSNLVDYSKAKLPTEIAKIHGGLTINLEKGSASLADEKRLDLLRKIQHAIGTAHNDKFVGNSEDNHFYGLDGLNRYEGKGGKNYFYGGKDQDIYIGGLGGGYDTIDDKGGDQDVYRMDMIIDQNKSFIEKEGNDVIMKFNNGLKTVKVLGQFDNNNSYRGVEYLQFMDGSTYKMSEILGSVSSWSTSHSFSSLNFDWTNKQNPNPIPTGWS